MYVCIYMHVCIIYMHVYTYTCMRVCVSEYMCVFTYIYTGLVPKPGARDRGSEQKSERAKARDRESARAQPAHSSPRIHYIDTYTCMHIHVCVYIYMYIYTHMFIHLYILHL